MFRPAKGCHFSHRQSCGVFFLKEILAAAQVVFTQVVSEGWGKWSMHLKGKHSAYFFAGEKNIPLRPFHWIIPEDPSYQLVETAPPRAVCSTVYAARSVCRVQSEIATKPLPANSCGHPCGSTHCRGSLTETLVVDDDATYVTSRPRDGQTPYGMKVLMDKSGHESEEPRN